MKLESPESRKRKIEEVENGKESRDFKKKPEEILIELQRVSRAALPVC